ncbi:mannose receptor, C type [Sarotherodon galilaeus]
MQWSLFLLVLLGQCCFFTCRLYEYHFIAENKSCRLRNSTQNQGEAWIGLNNNTGGNRTWHWSLPGVEYIQNDSSWNQNGRTDNELPGNCVRKRDKLVDVLCDSTMWFICYSDKKTLYLIPTLMNWTEAQSYCRSNHTDLASGLDQVDGKEIEALMKSKNSSFRAWIGLFRDSWRWSDGSDFSFRYWDMELFNDTQSNKKCAMTLLNRSGKWSSDECDKEKPFFCYDDKLILIKENKTWEEALDYCRKSHRNLASITNPQEQGWVQDKASNASSPFVWLGLRYSCTLDLWFWVNDKLVCYEKWSKEGKTEECGRAVGMQRGGQYEWM